MNASKVNIRPLETQEIAPRMDDGVDYSTFGVVLLWYKGHRLIWRHAGTCWTRLGAPHRYVPTELQVIKSREGVTGYNWTPSKELFKGRFSVAKVKECWPKIKEMMNLPDEVTPEMIDKAKTLVIA